MSAIHEVMVHFCDRGGFYAKQLKHFFDTFCTNDSFHELEFFSCWGGSFKKFFPELFFRYLANVGVDLYTAQVIYRKDTDQFILVSGNDILQNYFNKKIFDCRKHFVEMTHDELWDLLND